MAKATTCKDALAKWVAASGTAPEAAERVDLIGVCPPIEKMDSSLAALKACRHLALSTNNLDKIGNLAGLEALEVLSLGRNCLKKLENLEAVAGTLQQLWVSYNQIDRLAGIEKCAKLRVLFASNNKIKDWAEVDRLTGLPELEPRFIKNHGPWTRPRRAGSRHPAHCYRCPARHVLSGRAVAQVQRRMVLGGAG